MTDNENHDDVNGTGDCPDAFDVLPASTGAIESEADDGTRHAEPSGEDGALPDVPAADSAGEADSGAAGEADSGGASEAEASVEPESPAEPEAEPGGEAEGVPEPGSAPEAEASAPEGEVPVDEAGPEGEPEPEPASAVPEEAPAEAASAESALKSAEPEAAAPDTSSAPSTAGHELETPAEPETPSEPSAAENSAASSAPEGVAETAEPAEVIAGSEPTGPEAEPGTAVPQPEHAVAEPIPTVSEPEPEPADPEPALTMPEPEPEPDAASASASTSEHAPASHRRRGRAAALSGLAAAVVAVGGYLGLAYWQSGSLPASAQAAGVDLGGMSEDEAITALQTGTEDPAAQELTVTAGETEATLDPAAAGLSVDAEATVDAALGFSADPRVVWDRLFGDDELDLVLGTEEEKLAPVLSTTAEDLSREPVDATLTVDSGTPEVTESADGLVVTAEDLRTALTEQWLRTDGPLTVEPERTAPAVTTEAAERARADIAEPALSDDVVIEADDDGRTHSLTVSPEVLASTLRFEPSESALAPVFDEKALRTEVFDANPGVGKEPADASFRVNGDSLTVVPAQAGVGADPEELADQVGEAMVSESRTGEITLTETEPDFTTQDAEKADVSQTVAEFSTPYSSSPARDTNLRVATDKVRGTVLQPGEQFSLNETLGERTAAAGYKPAGVISGGQMKEDFGGGVSQVSTTLFNAAFFAGFDLDEHQAHSRYISRYPEGRETTLDWTSIDLKFTNTTDAPVVLDMHLAGGEVVARVLGSEKADVEASASDRFNFTSPSTVTESGPSCTPQSPGQGWSITIYRTIKDPSSGAVVSKDDFTTVYRPVNRVVCED
ncbi:VanW family protein [Brevibacterium sp.]|uniref:VanW family protein n=1 Tax=Brevibacterium sp. TaxID=1701 RepID=UPI0025C4446C|nr:VanW family protein [Brevibacterium sp.]